MRTAKEILSDLEQAWADTPLANVRLEIFAAIIIAQAIDRAVDDLLLAMSNVK